MMLIVNVPTQTVSEMNARDGWRARNKRRKEQQKAVYYCWKKAAFGKRIPALPCVVRLTRFGPRLFDDDNNVASMKHVRDEVAKLLNVDDGDEQIKFEYDQRGRFRLFGDDSSGGDEMSTWNMPPGVTTNDIPGNGYDDDLEAEYIRLCGENRERTVAATWLDIGCPLDPVQDRQRIADFQADLEIMIKKHLNELERAKFAAALCGNLDYESWLADQE